MAISPGSIVGVHLDLKYHMPKKAYLLEWVRELPALGVNTLLLEYEDKFPFARHPFLRDTDAFTPAELGAFLAAARGAGLRVIPLVQSLSHLEFALGHEELAHLREAADISTQICPSRDEAVDFVLALIAEVLACHGEDELLHCGGDEAWFLGRCGRRAEWKRRAGAVGMWAEHQRKVTRLVLGAGKRPILWDDIFWKEPHALRAAGLPQETILMSWDYGITRVPPGGIDAALPHVGAYRQAGYDAVATPCLNYGQLLPRLTPSIDNTRVWAAKAAAEGMLGLINSSWACFHVPLQAQLLLVAATGVLARDPQADVGPAWQRRWLEERFGAPARGAPEALEALGALWEIPMPAYGRPFTPLVYGYMNMVLHYPGRQDERRRRGAYPPDWGEIDFAALYRRGVEQVRAGDMAPVVARLDEVLASFPQARDSLAALADAARRHEDEARLLAELAELKLLGARVFSHLLRGDQDPDALREELSARRAPLEAALGRAYEPGGVQRLLRAWWEPLFAACGSGL
jgi:hypothetical protein